jgi:hypothetical protein
MEIVSVFIQNMPGRLSQIVHELEPFTIHGFSISDAGDFGIVQLCVDEPRTAMERLKRHDLIAHLTPALGVTERDMRTVIEAFEETGINVDEAIYAAIVDGEPLVVFKVSDTERALDVLEKRGIAYW